MMPGEAGDVDALQAQAKAGVESWLFSMHLDAVASTITKRMDDQYKPFMKAVQTCTLVAIFIRSQFYIYIYIYTYMNICMYV